MNRRWIVSSCALALAVGLSQVYFKVEAQSTPVQQQTPPAHPDVPDAPAPQAPPPMSDMKDSVTPGAGTQKVQPAPATPSTSSSGTQPSDGQQAPNQNPAQNPAQAQPPSNLAPSSLAPSSDGPDEGQPTPPEIPESGKGMDAIITKLNVYTNFVEVPVTVKDSKGQLVPGLTFRDFRVFENNKRQAISLFVRDSSPLSIAYVIDQSVTQDVMSKVNTSLGAIQGALTPSDDVAVFTYNNGSKEMTGFTGAQSHRLEAVLALSKATGREEGVPVNSGPLAGCGITSNGACVDPNLQQGRSAGGTDFMSIPKEIHTLNDAILRAATELSTRPKGRQRIVYVISDGKEYGSKATTREVIKYCQTNKVAVYATLVGDSARWGQGYLSRFHLPFQMNDNVLPKYTLATGGSLDAENSTNGIEKSYAKIAEEARTQYILGYISHEDVHDSRYRSIDIRVDRPNVDVTAKPGYYPTAQDLR